jgi:hypothetical protein
MIVGCILDYYIIYVLLLKVTTKGNGYYIICKKTNKKQKQIDNIDDNKNVDKFGFVASLT